MKEVPDRPLEQPSNYVKPTPPLKEMKYFVFFAYYVYALLLIAATGYIVFYKGHSGWWFFVTLVFISSAPSMDSSEGSG